MYKYEFTDEKRTVNGHTVRRIRAVKDFGTVKKGDLGGFLETAYNLNPFGKCWVTDNACVYGHAVVTDNAQVGENAIIGDSAKICDASLVYGDVKIGSDSYVGTAVCMIFGLNERDSEETFGRF